MSREGSKPIFQTIITDLLAGVLTAAVFYAEYIGLGTLLGAVLPGRSAAALGTLMVIGAVFVGCVLALAVPRPFIAGPRAASLAVLIVGMRFAIEHTSVAEGRFAVAMSALATMLVVSAATLLLGLNSVVQDFIKNTHISLRKGFVFATAVGIVVGLSASQLDGCLRISPILTVVVTVISLVTALYWAHVCRRVQAIRTWKGKFAPLSMIVGVGIATLGYYAFIHQYARDGLCGTLGSVGLQFSQLSELLVTPSTLLLASSLLPFWVWLVLVAIGFLQGGVLLLESLTTLGDSNNADGRRSWSSQLKLRAVVNLICAPLGLASSSLSASRTRALIEAHGKTRFAVLFHGLALVLILFFCSFWIAKLPNIAVAVALMLVAVQMIDDETRNTVWRGGYHPAATQTSVGITWIFWSVIALSVAAGSTLRYFDFGFGGGPLIALLFGALAIKLFSRSSTRETG